MAQPRGRWTLRVLSALALTCALGGANASCKQLASLAKKKPPVVFKRSRVDAALGRMLEPLEKDPKFKQAIERGPAGAKG